MVSISNDGGFGAARPFPVERRIPWKLDTSGPERLPIILDEVAPKILDADR